MSNEFDLVTPENLDQALHILSEKSPDISPVAGGTNLVVDMRANKHIKPTILNIEKLPELNGIKLENNYVQIGGCTKISELIKSPIILKHAPILVNAAKSFANPLIRNRATIGGNLVDASPAADTAPPLLVLGAEVEVANLSGSHLIPLDEFFLHVRKTQLKPDEILVSVRFKIPSPETKFSYYKLGLRKADAISIISTAVMLEMDSSLLCKGVRIALGSVAPKPIRGFESENLLLNKKIDEELIQKAAQIAAEASSPISDLRASAGYRRKMVKVLVARLLNEIVTGNKE
jgi:CO/xanthine dehydrogenase FAD-binding subunit